MAFCIIQIEKNFTVLYLFTNLDNLKLRIRLTKDKIVKIENLPSALIDMNEK